MTGCTVILCEEGAVAAMDLRGSASGSRQVDSLYPIHLVEKAQGVLLAGGSGYGLQAADGVMRYLEERDKGFNVTVGVVPIVPTAIIFDMGFGDARARPTPDMGYQACLDAKARDIAEGSVGAGTGAKVGGLCGIERAMKGGFGLSTVTKSNGLCVMAAAVVNAFGDVRDYTTGEILAGVRTDIDSRELADAAKLLTEMAELPPALFQNTTLVVVATNALLSKLEATKVAQMASTGLVKTTSPALTLYDGDMVFVLSTGALRMDLNIVGYLAEVAVGAAINRAVKAADGFGRLPAYRDIRRAT
jgi:L-aminopeptidase/D-esterase-like protein